MIPEEKRISTMTAKISGWQKEVAQLQGEQKQIDNQFEAIGCTSEEAEELIVEENRKIKKLTKKLNNGLDKLEEEYDWQSSGDE